MPPAPKARPAAGMPRPQACYTPTPAGNRDASRSIWRASSRIPSTPRRRCCGTGTTTARRTPIPEGRGTRPAAEAAKSR